MKDNEKQRTITTSLLESQVKELEILRKEKGILKSSFIRLAVKNELNKIKNNTSLNLEFNPKPNPINSPSPSAEGESCSKNPLSTFNKEVLDK
jgi:hypothetical protein